MVSVVIDIVAVGVMVERVKVNHSLWKVIEFRSPKPELKRTPSTGSSYKRFDKTETRYILYVE